MAVGKSNRIVVEVEPEFKAMVYAALKARGQTFKEWFTEQAARNLLKTSDKLLSSKMRGRLK